MDLWRLETVERKPLKVSRLSGVADDAFGRPEVAHALLNRGP